MSSFWDRLMGRRDPHSAQTARERLKLVLVTDRSNLSPDRLEQMQSEIIQVIRKYIEIEADAVQIKLEHRNRKTYLVADVPLERDHKYDAALAAPDAPDDPPPDEA